MMVSKVAVIAMVAIVACPILLGYAFNLSEVTKTDYKLAGDSVNVTPLLSNGTEYDDVYANTYQLNSNFIRYSYNLRSIPAMPMFNTISSTKSSISYSQYTDDNWAGGRTVMAGMITVDYSMTYTNAPGIYVRAVCYDISFNVLLSVDRIAAYHFDANTQTLQYLYYADGNTDLLTAATYQFTTDVAYIDYAAVGSNVAVNWGYTSNTSDYVDLSDGFYFNAPSASIGGVIKLPDKTKSYLLTINLDSITDSDYDCVINDQKNIIHLIKTTTDGNVSWVSDHGSLVQDLYYDSTRNDNTYQLFVRYNFKYESNGYNYYSVHSELRYVGGWPTILGNANSFFTYDYDLVESEPTSQVDVGLAEIRIYRLSSSSQTVTPTLRMDQAKYLGFQYSTITDKVYDPAAFKTNPSTKISSINKYGSSIEFGGTVYNVTDGNITIGTHDLSIRNVVFDSIPTAGGYVNRINGIAISTTATPSTITFGGVWSANVITDSMESASYTHTEWTPGQFGWDGLDQNFLMVGLLTSVGAFIALGIYIRRTKAALWPLLIVCGGAAMLFFCML